MKRFFALLVLVCIAGSLLNDIHFTSYDEPGLAQKNAADAYKAKAEGDQIYYNMDRQRRQDDGIMFNTLLDMISGNGTTPMQKFGAGAFSVLAVVFLLPLAILLGMIWLWKRQRATEK